jgi:RimJ/RimL family protein N-acetyltransferase
VDALAGSVMTIAANRLQTLDHSRSRMIFRSIIDESELDLLVSLSRKRDTTARWIAGMIARGETRADWCRLAIVAGELVAAHAFDSFHPGAPIRCLNLLGHRDPTNAAALIDHDLSGLDIASVEAQITVYHDAERDLAALRESQAAVLIDAGFELAVHRVQLRWTGTAPRVSDRLQFRPASQLPAEELERLFREVTDGSLDHSMTYDRAETDPVTEACDRLARARARAYQDGWFAVGVDDSGEPVGYVQSALVGDRPILAEIGVVQSRRGVGYSNDLLAYGTAVVADHGYVDSTTDAGNTPMRAAFARAGYVESGSRRDFRWRRAPESR